MSMKIERLIVNPSKYINQKIKYIEKNDVQKRYLYLAKEIIINNYYFHNIYSNICNKFIESCSKYIPYSKLSKG